MCNSRKYPYLPHGRDFFLRAPPLWKFHLSFIHFFKFFGLTEPPTPQEIPIPSVGEYGYFLELHNFICDNLVVWYTLLSSYSNLADLNIFILRVFAESCLFDEISLTVEYCQSCSIGYLDCT